MAIGIIFLTGCWKGPGPAVEPPPVAVAVLPAEARLTVDRAMTFAAQVDGEPAGEVNWRVVEPGGGTVDAAGTYRAPAVPGVYTVQADFKVRSGQTASAKVTVVAPPAGAINAPPRLMPGALGQRAGIAPVPGSSYRWSITGGEITAGTETPAITFAAGTGPKVLLRCKVNNLAGDVLNTSLEVPVVPPVTLDISPAVATITAERAMKFGFSIAGGISLGVTWSLGEPGAGSLDKAGHYLAPPVPGLYTVRVTSVDDPTQIAVAKVRVVPKPPESLFAPDTFQPGAQGLRATVPDLQGMTYAWSIDGGTMTSGAASPALIFNAGDEPSITLHCKVTNAAGDSFVAAKTIKAF